MTPRYVLSTVIELLGLLAVIYGVALIYVPAAVIVAGLVGLFIGTAIDPPVGKARKQ